MPWDETLLEPVVSSTFDESLLEPVADPALETKKAALRAEKQSIAFGPSEFMANASLGLLNFPKQVLGDIDSLFGTRTPPEEFADMPIADDPAFTGRSPESLAKLQEFKDRFALLESVQATDSPSLGVRKSVVGGIEAMTSPSGVAILGATIAAPSVMGPVLTSMGIEGSEDAVERIKKARETGDRTAYYHAVTDALQMGGMIFGGAKATTHPLFKETNLQRVESQNFNRAAAEWGRETALELTDPRRGTEGGPGFVRPQLGLPPRPPVGSQPPPVAPSVPKLAPSSIPDIGADIASPFMGRTVTFTRQLTTTSEPQKTTTKVVKVVRAPDTRGGSQRVEVVYDDGTSTSVNAGKQSDGRFTPWEDGIANAISLKGMVEKTATPSDPAPVPKPSEPISPIDKAIQKAKQEADALEIPKTFPDFLKIMEGLSDIARSGKPGWADASRRMYAYASKHLGLPYDSVVELGGQAQKSVDAFDKFRGGQAGLDAVRDLEKLWREKSSEPITVETPISQATREAGLEAEAAALETTAGARRAERAESLVEGVRPGPMLSTLPPVPTVAPKALSQVIRDLSKGLSTPIRFGRLITRKFGGYFMPKPNLITSKFANDIVVTSHEVGHRVDQLFSLRGEPAIRTELEHLGDNTRPGSMSSWTKSKTKDYRRGEGVAEFMRYWLTDKAEAQKLAPTMFAHFENVLNSHTDLANVLNQAREDIRLWRTAEPQARLRSQISTGENPSKTRYSLSQLTSDLLDDLHYMRLATDDVVRLGDPALKPSENPYLLARNLRGAYGMADTFIRHGQIDFKTKEVTGKGLEQVLKPVGPRMNDFVDYIVSRQAREMRGQGKETGLVPADVDFVFNKFNGDAEFNAAFNELKQWSDSFIKYSVDAGYLSVDAAAAMRRMNQEYVPFHRVFEVGAGEFGTEAGTGRGLNAVGQAFKGRKGSRRDIVNPLETYVKNAYAIITNAEKNAINIALADLSNHTGMGKWVEKVGTPKEGQRVGLEKLREQLEDAGADLTGVPDDLLLTFWKDSKHAPSGENIIKVNRAGKLEFYRLDRDLFRTVSALDAEHAGVLLKMLSQPSQVLRAGATLTPDFAVSNALKDTVIAAINSRYGFFPVENTVRGLYALLKNPKLVSEWKASGGSQSVEAHYFDRPALQKFLKERISKDFSYADYIKYVAKSPLSALRILTGTLENATRIGEYQIVLNKLLKQGYEVGEARRLAAYESRDLQDFAMGGSRTKQLRRLTAFWNAAVQGEYRLVRNLKDPKTRWMTMAKGFAWVTVPTVGLFMLNKDDPDYWDRPYWERDNFWLVPRGKDETGHTKFWRIPKPFTYGVLFAAMPERILSRWYREDPNAFNELGTTMTQNLPNPTPQWLNTLYGAFGSGEQGYDTFRKRKIIPDSMADFPSDLQFTEQTSLTAKKAGKLIGISPMKVDYIINQTTGGLGRQTVNQGLDRVISWMTGEPRTARAAYPMGRFMGTPSGTQSQAVDDFYTELDRLRQEKAREKQTGEGDSSGLKMMEKQADIISKLRKSQREETDALERQKISLHIREIAETALGREPKLKFDESLLIPVE